MRWCVSKNTCQRTAAYEGGFKDLRQKQYEVEMKEKELLERELRLEKLLNGVNKRCSGRAKKDLVAAHKLKQARKQLIQAMNTKEKLDKSKKKYAKEKSNKKKRAKSKKKTKNMKTGDRLHKFFDNFFKMDNNFKKIAKIKREDFFASLLSRIFMQAGSRSPRSDGSAGDCYLMSLQRTPQVWIHHHWPQLYPPYLDLRAQYKNCKFVCMFVLGFLFWIPCFIFIEVCKCFLCCCFHDC